MANKLAKLISELDYNDLLLIKKDLDVGNIEKLITFHLQEKKANKKTICPVCGNEVKEGVGFHLQFGPSELRKKATFDGVDCMQYFIKNLKKKTINKKDNPIQIN